MVMLIACMRASGEVPEIKVLPHSIGFYYEKGEKNADVFRYGTKLGIYLESSEDYKIEIDLYQLYLAKKGESEAEKFFADVTDSNNVSMGILSQTAQHPSRGESSKILYFFMFDKLPSSRSEFVRAKGVIPLILHSRKTISQPVRLELKEGATADMDGISISLPKAKPSKKSGFMLAEKNQEFLDVHVRFESKQRGIDIIDIDFKDDAGNMLRGLDDSSFEKGYSFSGGGGSIGVDDSLYTHYVQFLKGHPRYVTMIVTYWGAIEKIYVPYDIIFELNGLREQKKEVSP